jgi:hypothetical protein
VASLPVLEGIFGIGLGELMERKKAGAEKMLLDEREVALHDARLGDIEARLVAAHEKSSLPEKPVTAAAIEDFVVRLRLSRDGFSAG